MSNQQQTIREPITIQGVGLHTGRKCRAVFKPAEPNQGIKFVRTDLPGNPEFIPHVKNVVDVVRGTSLGSGEHRIYTIEHVLSAFNGLEIDNVVVELDDNEPPVADGSSKEFVEAIQKVGVVEQEAQRNYFTVSEPLEYSSKSTSIRIEPAETLEIDCEVDYDHPLLRNQRFVFNRSKEYTQEIAPARTYCFDYEIEALKKKGLAKGGSLDNAIVVGPAGIYNPGSFLRFKDEFVRHKTLDLMGDLMLLGLPIQARIIAKRCGHGHNVNFVKQLLAKWPVSDQLTVR